MTDEVQQVAAPETAAPEPAAPAWSPDAEQEARALGWKSPDEWQGNIPAGYIDNPERYLQRAESFTPFRKVKERLDEVERKAEERLRKMETTLSRTFERELQTRMAELQAQKVQAVEVGDVDKFKAIERQQAELSKQAAEIPQAPKQEYTIPPDHRAAIEQWSVGKEWFKTDKAMTLDAASYYGEAEKQGLTDPRAILAYVDQKMAAKYAILAPKQAVTPVEAGLTFGGGSQATSFDKLPKDAKDAFQRFVKQGLFKDTKEGRAAYAEDYNAA